YFIMRLVEGKTFAEGLARRTGPGQDLPRFLKVFEQICQTLAYAHSAGVVHRDLKPSNVMVGLFGEVQVMDWGVAKLLTIGGETAEAADDAGGVETGRGAAQTQPGSVAGTLVYMPPEQAKGEVGRLDERCDVFALGATLCEILTGKPPYGGPEKVEVHRQA